VSTGLAEAATRAALARITAGDPRIRAWEFVGADAALAEARRHDAAAPGPLHGWTVGVKDIIDVAGMPTTCGSEIYRDNGPAVKDAACVALARSAGATIVGKTVTTEFAFSAPSRTRNPWNLAHSPGGSSSGSAAAVADGHVRVAFGTQTGGSILRPSSYCGVVGYKPTFGSISLAGVRPLATSFDTLGWIARSVADCVSFRDALLGLEPAAGVPNAPRLGFYRSPAWEQAEPAMRALVERIATECGAVDVSLGFDDFDEIGLAIQYYEMRQNLATEWLQHNARVSPQTRAALELATYDLPRYVQAKQRLQRFDADAAFGTTDVLLMPAAAGEAPDPAHTGDPIFNRTASILGLPAITIPIELGPQRLPLGVQLVARRHADEQLLSAALALAERYPFARALTL
jgi:Asp-tRNA(Asn)/Glu-tRNA(Gln) amidotransferase A subunit family amidase